MRYAPRPGLGVQVVIDAWNGSAAPFVAEPRGDGRELLAHPITLDHVERLRPVLQGSAQAIAVNDPDGRLVLCNRRYHEVLQLPDAYRQEGAFTWPAIDFLAHRGEYGDGPPERHATFRKRAILEGLCFQLERDSQAHQRLLVGGCPLPGGGYVTTLTELLPEASVVDPVAALLADRSRASGERVPVLGQLVEHDPRLGIPSRAAFDRITRVLGELQDGQASPGSLLLVGLAGVRRAASRHGHEVAAELSRAVVVAVRSRLRRTDLLACYEEAILAILLPWTPPKGALALAQALSHLMAGIALPVRAAVALPESAIGVSQWHPAEAAVGPALQRAEASLREAEAAGAGSIRWSS
ncbi:PAS-domain containing protein [Roseomonas sp. OT10]|uniref:sensor domain-containing diguanylate cyclase n=1 Tax=Roseomonas cutis TaxID=2897332 RepID=UPI001E4D75F2|nr:PAS-domain containing protein [Roseomonas sp. OT10]UFN50436.1 PAS-domain containing protein [Roseomonas sp. OT10]